MSQTDVKTGDLDLDIQGQIGLETKKFCVIPCEQQLLNHGNFTMQQLLNCFNFTFKLELCIDHLKVLQYFKNL